MSASTARVVVRGPAALIAVVPHLLGFHPESSFVLVALAGPRSRIRLAFRYDPPGQAITAAIAGHAVAVLHREQLRTAAVTGHGPGRLVTPVTPGRGCCPEHAGAHIQAADRLTRHAASGYVAALASLLAFTAWQAGLDVLATSRSRLPARNSRSRWPAAS